MEIEQCWDLFNTNDVTDKRIPSCKIQNKQMKTRIYFGVLGKATNKNMNLNFK